MLCSPPPASPAPSGRRLRWTHTQAQRWPSRRATGATGTSTPHCRTWVPPTPIATLARRPLPPHATLASSNAAILCKTYVIFLYVQRYRPLKRLLQASSKGLTDLLDESLLSLLPLGFANSNEQVGVTCNPIVPEVGAAAQCNQQTVCCDNTSFVRPHRPTSLHFIAHKPL